MHARAREKCKNQDITRAELEIQRKEIKESQRVCEKIRNRTRCEQTFCSSVIQGARGLRFLLLGLGEFRRARGCLRLNNSALAARQCDTRYGLVNSLYPATVY